MTRGAQRGRRETRNGTSGRTRTHLHLPSGDGLGGPVVSGIDLRRRSTARFALNGVAQGKAVQRAISGCWRRALNRVFLRLRQVAAFTSQARVRMRAGMQRFAGFGIACCGWTPGL